MHLILASTSPYRRSLLERLGLPFEQCKPDFDEAGMTSMPPIQLVEHNTLGKARSMLQVRPDACIIASDQVAVCGDITLGKPGSLDKAEQQLAFLSGKRVSFLTGLCLLSQDQQRYDMITYHVHFRTLSSSEIHHYVQCEAPINCAGSFKSEGLGIALFEKMEGDDPTALIGLPLIRLSQWLQPLRQPISVSNPLSSAS